MSRRSEADVRARFRALVTEWQRNPFGAAAAGGVSEMSAGVERIDEKLKKIAEQWPDTTNVKSLVELRVAGVTALSLLLERYHREQGLYIAAAELMVHAIRTAHENDPNVSPFLKRPGALHDLEQYVPDRSHQWIRAYACVCVILLVLAKKESIEAACERVAKELSNADYKPPRGGARVGAAAIKGWVRKISSEATPEVQEARQAFAFFLQMHQRSADPALDIANDASIGDECLRRFAEALKVLIIRSSSQVRRKRSAGKIRPTDRRP